MGKHTDIEWHEWGEEAFLKARETGKAVLLDLSAVWCHWCHVMDDTSYSDDEIIRLINEDFVPIRVDIDRRPDIRERYNFGGYPTTAFLDADGEVIAGGTYIPPDQMRRTLVQVKGYVGSRGGEARPRKVQPESRVEKARGTLEIDVFEEVLGYLLEQFDELHGGFGNAPKFPQPEAIDLALYKYKLSGNNYFRNIVEKSLSAMAGGGIYDAVEGGFFRYSVTRDWSEPHYEKMLEVNVGLLRNYLNAYALLGEPWYAEVARDVLRYLEGGLRDSEGAFYGSQDADEEYYAMSQEERAKVEPPFVDRTLYADLNAQAVSTYLRAGVVLKEEHYLEVAKSALDRMEERVLGEDGSLHHYWDGGSGIDGLLADYVHFAKAYLEAYEHFGERTYLERCKALVSRILTDLRDETGILIDRKAGERDIGLLKMPQKPLVENSHAALLLLKLREITGDETYGDAAEGILKGLSGQYSRYSIFASTYAMAVSMYIRGPLRLVLVGHKGDEEAKEIGRILAATFEPRRVMQLLEPGTADFKEAQYPEDPIPAVYACVGKQCSPPITGVQAVREVEAFLEQVEGSGEGQGP